MNPEEFVVLFRAASINTQRKIIEFSRRFFDEAFDENYEKAVEFAKRKGCISSESLRRELDSHYGETNRLIIKMQENNIISKHLTLDPKTLSGFYLSLIR